MNHAKTSFSTEIFGGAIIIVVQYLAPQRHALPQAPQRTDPFHQWPEAAQLTEEIEQMTLLTLTVST
jgi:hypothetical protein